MKESDAVTFVLIDDDEVDRQVVTRALRAMRVLNPIVEFEDARSALAALRGEAEMGGLVEPMIVLLDLKMPGMDGHEFLDEIRHDERLVDLIVFVLTTSDLQIDESRARDNFVAGYLHKGKFLKPEPEQRLVDEILRASHYQRIVENPQVA